MLFSGILYLCAFSRLAAQQEHRRCVYGFPHTESFRPYRLLLMQETLEPALYLVPVPIGNLSDITLRALEHLRRADIVACEDTRTTGQLLKLLGVSARKLVSYHEHNEEASASRLLDIVRNGGAVALVSDAGSPCISDPGYRIVTCAHDAGLRVVPLPGASAFVLAVMASGLPTNEFTFMGFPPHKKGRKTFVERVVAEPRTVVLYESPYRIERLLEELETAGAGHRRVCICRELTKMHEEVLRGTVEQCRQTLAARASQKGEFALVIEGAQEH